MEIAGGGIAVASIAIQLIDSAVKLHNFFTSIEDAPVELQSLKDSLEVLLSILRSLRNENTSLDPQSDLARAPSQCQAYVDSATTSLDSLLPGFGSQSSSFREWAALKSVFKSSKIESISKNIEAAKSTLIVALVNTSRQLQISHHAAQIRESQQSTASLERTVADHSRRIADEQSRDLSNAVAAINAQQFADRNGIIRACDTAVTGHGADIKHYYDRSMAKLEDSFSRQLALESRTIVSSQRNIQEERLAEMSRLFDKLPVLIRSQVKAAATDAMNETIVSFHAGRPGGPEGTTHTEANESYRIRPNEESNPLSQDSSRSRIEGVQKIKARQTVTRYTSFGRVHICVKTVIKQLSYNTVWAW